LVEQVNALNETVAKLPKNREKYESQVKDCLDALNKAMMEVKTDVNMTEASVKKKEAEMQAKIDKQLAAIRKEQEKQKLADEAARLKKIAEEMEAERKRKEQAEAERQAAEEELAARKAMEAEQKKRDEEAALLEEKRRIQAEKEAASAKAQKAAQEAKRKEMEEAAALEQERRDQELAMRLAMDHASAADAAGSGALSDEAKAQAAMGQAKRRKGKAVNYDFGNKKQEALHKKHDLSKWKYADLRDTINTSCDIDLLEACREEFHRRLKVYHAWKMKNMNKEKKGQAGRAPEALRSAASGAAPAAKAKKKKGSERPQRYFRIPFVRPDANADAKGGKKGWWFAHFDGQWIARQMELHPDKPPVLLVAGADDMEMCELSLDETGLARKRGAEILPREFEDEWRNCGGKPYVKASQ